MNLNILCFNIHKGFGWGRNVTIKKIHSHIATLQYDIIFLQEIRGSQVEMLSTETSYYVSYGKNSVTAKGNHGNAVLSKYPIIFSQNTDISMHRLERRGLLHTVIKMPDNQFIHLFCVHLGLRKVDRKKQLHIIKQYITEHTNQEDKIILAGDFNDWTRYATIPIINELRFSEAFLECRKHYAKTYPAWIPMLKLDRVYYRGFQIIDAHRLIDRSWRFLSDHIGLMVLLRLE